MKLEKEVEIIKSYLKNNNNALIEFEIKNINNEEYKKISNMHFKKIKLTLEVEEPILDEEERKYLSGVIRPFRDRVKCIKKEKDSNKREYITIVYDDGWLIPLPFFENNIMYKNLELGKEYKLEDLRL